MKYILHYTDPGAMIFDGFCGTGMTGVASRLCGDKKELLNVGFEIDKEGNIRDRKNLGFLSKIGKRYTILNDLSPSASLISYVYNTNLDDDFKKELDNLIVNLQTKYNWLYETFHTLNGKQIYRKEVTGKESAVKGMINYTVWSDVIKCTNCQAIFTYWEISQKTEKKGNDEEEDDVVCLNCKAKLTKDTIERVIETKFDTLLGKSIQIKKQIPVLINYYVEELNSKGKKGFKQYDKIPDKYDLELIEKINSLEISTWVPTDPIMFKGSEWGDTWRKGYVGLTNTHQFYTKRNLIILSDAYIKNRGNKAILFLLQSINFLCSKLTRYNINRGNGPLTGTFYIPSLHAEMNVINTLINKIDGFKKLDYLFNEKEQTSMVSCGSSTDLRSIPNNCIDYIFTDPPFGQNLKYSELNFLWESWLRVFTNNKNEAVISNCQKKLLIDYQNLMELCFKENFRILKSGRWMTVEFHNSKNSVWNAIQEAILKAGFIIADVRILDKKQGTFNQITSTSAVKADLIISAYKPREEFEKKFILDVENKNNVWEFVTEHLKHLPIVSEKGEKMEIVIERQKYLIYDRMVAFYIQHRVNVPISSPEFYLELDQRFPERNGMYFLPDQVLEYDRRRLENKEWVPLQLYVSDEKSAIRWIKNELRNKPQTYQEIQPNFIKQLLSLEKYEKMPELSVILEQNCIKDDEEKWHLPDPNKESDLEKIRNKHLVKEFNEYMKEKKLKQFRTEAIRAGFKEAWDRRDYDTIILLAEKIPEQIIQEDQTLLMYYDNAIQMKPRIKVS